MPIIRTEARRLYRCDCCGKTDIWSDGWRWFGSYRQLDEDEPVMTMCSAECTIKLVAANKLPHDGIGDDGNVIADDSEEKPPSRRRSVAHSRPNHSTPETK